MNALPLKKRGNEKTEEEQEQHAQHLRDSGVNYWELSPEQKDECIYHSVSVPVHYFPITPSLRQQIKTEGLPQYQRGGMIHKAVGGSIQGGAMPTLAQMRLALSQHNPSEIQSVGINEAINMSPKMYFPPDRVQSRVPPPGGVATPSGMPIGGIDQSQMTPGQQLMPQQQPQEAAQGPLPGPQDQQQGPSNILQMTPQGQTMAALQPQQGQQPQAMSNGGRMSTQQMAAELMSKASRSAGMKAPVTAAKNLNSMQDYHQSLGDRVRQGASDMQNMIESMPHKYEIGEHVFTKDSAKKNKRPYKILAKYPFGNQPMREDHPQLGPGMGKVIKDPQTGKAKRTPYEPGYRVRHEMGPDEFSEFHIPESAILGKVELAGGGQPTQALAKGNSAKSVAQMKAELAASKKKDKRITIHAQGSGGVKGIIVPRHTLEGNAKSGAVGLHEMNEARAKVYGGHHRDPLTISKIGSLHKSVLQNHFGKPLDEQIQAEEEATNRLRQAKHLGKTADTLDESEKLDTVRNEHDEQGRTHVGYASKGVAGHALFTSGHGENTKYNVINTCPGQTEGCGGGKDAHGIVDTMKGTCFAPNAESQYPAAAVRRAAHEQAKHDPEMTSDWILAHTGSLRNAASRADKGNKRLLFRPNVVDETDVSSRHVIRHLNEQRRRDGKPDIIANSYGKTNELHDPENGYYVTHSNVGPKVKKGQEVSENIGRDKARVRNTIMAADNKGDFKNEQGNLTPPKGSYMVTDVKRGSPLAKSMEKSITHAKYWTTGRTQDELTKEEKEEGPEGHFGPNGRRTTEDKAHYGHRTVGDKRYDYQKQHILHPRLVQVGSNKDGTPHMIPTDSRFKDTEFLPKNRFKTKNGKEAGHILMTTPTESTSNLGHQTSFTHHVNEGHIKHALANKGEYQIDAPEDQEKAKGKEYAAPQAIKFYAEGGSAGEGRHPGLSDDDFHAFPERNYAAMRHLAMRRGDDEEMVTKTKKPVAMHQNVDTMRLALTKKAK
jgi:hypothetical protein